MQPSCLIEVFKASFVVVSCRDVATCSSPPRRQACCIVDDGMFII